MGLSRRNTIILSSFVTLAVTCASSCLISGSINHPTATECDLGTMSLAASPASPTAGATSVLQISGTIPTSTAITWSTDNGTISGKGMRVNLTPASAGTANVTAQSSCQYNSATLAVTVAAAAPLITVTSVTTGPYTVNGQISGLGSPDTFNIGVYQQNAGTFTNLSTINSTSGVYSNVPATAAGTDRVNFMLVDPSVILGNAGFCLAGSCGPTVESFADTFYNVPFDLDGVLSLSFATSYLETPGADTNTLIAEIQGLVSPTPTTTNAGTLTRSTLDLDNFKLRDQGLAILALTVANEPASALLIMEALADAEIAAGISPNFYNLSYDANNVGTGTAGPEDVAWVLLAASYYFSVTAEATFTPVVAANAYTQLNAMLAVAPVTFGTGTALPALNPTSNTYITEENIVVTQLSMRTIHISEARPRSPARKQSYRLFNPCGRPIISTPISTARERYRIRQIFL